jgi:hypothetical protein
MKPPRLALPRKELKRDIKTLSLISIKIGFALLANCEASVHSQFAGYPVPRVLTGATARTVSALAGFAIV